METAAAPDTTWEVRVRWGDRRLEAVVLDGRGRRSLSLGDGEADDIQLGHSAQVRCEWDEGALRVRFSSGVTGTARLRGDGPASLTDLVHRGVVREDDAGWEVRLAESDELELLAGRLRIEVRRGRGRFQRLPFDARVLALIVLAALAVGVILASVSRPPELPKLRWLKR
jgi:hypothetical protein